MTTSMPRQRAQERLAPRRLAQRMSLQALPFYALLVDLVLIALVIVLAVYVRTQLSHVLSDAPLLYSFVLGFAVPMGVGWLGSIWALGGYQQRIFGAGTEEFKRVSNATLLGAALIGIACYLFGYPLSRGFYVVAVGLGLPMLALGRLGLRRLLQAARRAGRLTQTVLISGYPQHVDEVAAVLRREPWMGYRVVGALTPEPNGETTAGGVPVLDRTHQLTGIVGEHGIDVVIFAGGAFSDATELRRATWAMEGLHAQMIVVPSITDVSRERLNVRPIGGLPLMHLEGPRAVAALHWLKRAFDVIGAAILLVCTMPVAAYAALTIKLHDGGPVYFRQRRVGLNGAEFEMLKFRSMRVDAEQHLAELRERTGDQEILFKLPDDPRVTKPGRWLRRSSLDELPQLWNVLRGQMSLVGPRPSLPSEVDRYEAHVSRRLRVRPGMTGLWQVSGRSDLSWNDTVRLDLYYVDNWSMVQDLSILLRTVSAVIKNHGAY